MSSASRNLVILLFLLFVGIVSGHAQEVATGSVVGTAQVIGPNGLRIPELAIINLTPKPGTVVPKREPKEFTVSTKGKRFKPRHLIIRVGDTVQFPNNDFFKHNVFSLSEGNQFDFGTYRRGESPSRTFQKTGLVRIYCNIHAAMSSFILVSDYGIGTISERSGRYKISEVPVGQYKVKAWSLRGSHEVDLVVEKDKVTSLNFKIDASGITPTPHKNKFGEEYDEDDEFY